MASSSCAGLYLNGVPDANSGARSECKRVGFVIPDFILIGCEWKRVGLMYTPTRMRAPFNGVSFVSIATVGPFPSAVPIPPPALLSGNPVVLSGNPSGGHNSLPSAGELLEDTNLDQMKHILKIMALLLAISAFWISLLQTSVVPHNYTWLLPIYLIVSLGCYGLLMVGVGLMCFPTCPQEAVLLQKDIAEAKGFLKERGVDVGAD